MSDISPKKSGSLGHNVLKPRSFCPRGLDTFKSQHLLYVWGLNLLTSYLPIV